jgi:hypothetical protein
MTLNTNSAKPGVMKQSRAKIWIRTGLLTIFGTLFGLQLAHNIAAGYFHWTWAALIFAVCLPIGYWMRSLVPMQVHPEHRVVTLTLDKIYFVTIWVLVIAKYVAFYAFQAIPVSDVIMCIILGLMAGRLSGICLRVSQLKFQHGFNSPENA